MVAERLKSGTWTTLPRAIAPDDSELPPMPCHLRCVMEVLSAQQHAAEAFWIEDRAISHGRLAGAVCVLDVLDQLQRQGLIGDVRRAVVIRDLRQAGYSFLPVVPTEVRAKIEAAPVDELGLVETPALTELRQWFAEEIARLTHIETNAQAAEDGSIIGEIRHVLDIAGLARTIFWTSGLI